MRYQSLLVILSVSGLALPIILASNRHVVRRVVVLGYLMLMGIILLTPISFTGSQLMVMPAGTGQVNLTHLDLGNLQGLENTLLTVPLGVLLKYRWPQWSFRRLALIGLAFGGTIESSQYVLSHLLLINRSSDINDVLTNALGLAIGGLLAAGFTSATHHIPSIATK